MKKRLSVMVGMVLLMMLTTALADENAFCDEIPQAVMQMELADNPDAVFSDCILIEGTPQGDFCFVLSPWSMNGYLLKDGAWQNTAQVLPMQQENNAFMFFQRHTKDANLQNEPAQSFEDDIGFDIVRSDSREPGADADVIRYHWRDGDFRVAGWKSKASDEYAAWKDDQWFFYNRSTGASLGNVQIQSIYQYGLLSEFTSLPLTLEQAQAMEAITQPRAEMLFPGWTLSTYEEYNHGHAAEAGYFRIEGGLLTIRRVALSSEKGIDFQTDTMPVPLSAALLALLQTEEASTFIDTSGYGDSFLREESFSRERIPVVGTVLQHDMQTHGLLLLTEDENGARRICWVEKEGDHYDIRTSNPLPQDAYFDLFHSVDDEVIVHWDDEKKYGGFSRTTDDSWKLGWMMGNSEEGGGYSYSVVYCGIAKEGTKNIDDVAIGAHPWQDLFSIDFFQLPASYDEAMAGLNGNGWAKVNNPVATDRLHLRTAPDRASVSLGKFYNGTPVELLGQEGDWSSVRIGLDGHLEGWMLTKYLAFGTAMNNVVSAMPSKMLHDTYANHPLYTSALMKETSSVAGSLGRWIIGVVEDELFILLDTAGNTGYLPQKWFWDGNG